MYSLYTENHDDSCMGRVKRRWARPGSAV